MDLITDWHNELIKQMKDLNLVFDEKKDKSVLAIEYFNFLRKQDLGKKWRILKSKEFHCPIQYRTALEDIKNLLEHGGDISPYLSIAFKDLIYQDGLFNDWGILHLHLGDKPHQTQQGFISRTGPLLFLYKDNGVGYFLDVFNHGDWTNKKVLQIIQDNWPELLDRYRVQDTIRLSNNFSEKEHFAMREAGGLVFMELEDRHGNPTVILPPHFGIASSGHANQDVSKYDYEYKKIKQLEEKIQQNIDEIVKKMLSYSIEPPKKFKFHLSIEDGNPLIREHNTGFTFWWE